MQNIDLQYNRHYKYLFESLIISNLIDSPIYKKVMTIRNQEPRKELINSILETLPNINQWRRVFVIETLILFMLCLSVEGLTFFSLQDMENIKNKDIDNSLKSALIIWHSIKS